jgi:hypothetical protein
MKTMFVNPKPLKKGGYTALLKQKLIEKRRFKSIRLLFSVVDLKPKRKYKPYYKFYTVYKNETAVTQVSTNNFKSFQPVYLKIKAACSSNSKENPAFSIPTDDCMAYGFLSQVKAMEFAKAGALKYISRLIDEGQESFDLLVAYREAHYEDLNFNLTEKNISKLALS